MNRIFYALVAVAFLFAAWGELTWEDPAPPAVEAVEAVEEPAGGASSAAPVDPELAALTARIAELEAAAAPEPEPVRRPMEAVGAAILAKARGAVELVLSILGAMVFFLGLMKVGEDGGLLRIVARAMRPVMVRLFPDVPPDHPAMGAMIFNFSANALGLGNAATPFGLKAIAELNRLSTTRGTATNAMVLFLAINTSNIALLPTGMMAIREALGSTQPAAIMPTTLMATLLSTTVAIVTAKALQRLWPSAEASTPEEDRLAPEAIDTGDVGELDAGAWPAWASWTAIALFLACIPLAIVYGREVAPWIIPLLTFGMLTFGFVRGVPVYESFVAGGKEGFEMAVRIIPFLVAILGVVGMFDASGALDALVGLLDPLTRPLGMPGEALPMALLRPLSGSGALGVAMAIMSDPATGPDTYTGFLVSTLQGSTETTFYVLALYFGSVGVVRVRHGLVTALTADLAGIVGAVLACTAWFAWAM